MSPPWHRRKRRARCFARRLLRDPSKLSVSVLHKFIRRLQNHHGSAAPSAALVEAASLMPKTWQCQKCFWSHSASHKRCSWCGISKQEAMRWTAAPSGSSNPSAVVKEQKSDHGLVLPWMRPIATETVVAPVVSQAQPTVSPAVEEYEMSDADVDNDEIEDCSQKRSAVQPELSTLKEELELKEELWRAAKSRSSESAKQLASSLAKEISLLKNEISKHKPLRTRLKKLRGGLKWRQERLNKAVELSQLKQGELESAQEAVRVAQRELNEVHAEIADVELQIEVSEKDPSAVQPSSVSPFDFIYKLATGPNSGISSSDLSGLTKVLAHLAALAAPAAPGGQTGSLTGGTNAMDSSISATSSQAPSAPVAPPLVTNVPAVVAPVVSTVPNGAAVSATVPLQRVVKTENGPQEILVTGPVTQCSPISPNLTQCSPCTPEVAAKPSMPSPGCPPTVEDAADDDVIFVSENSPVGQALPEPSPLAVANPLPSPSPVKVASAAVVKVKAFLRKRAASNPPEKRGRSRSPVFQVEDSSMVTP